MRKLAVFVLPVVMYGMAVAAQPQSKAVTFAKADLDQVPTGWKAGKTGQGEGSVWKVVADDTAPSKSGLVLAQTAAGPTLLYNHCVLQDGDYKDVELRVAFKAVKGNRDQGGGFVWRYQDANNYYVARFNPLEDNYRLYHFVDGRRTQLATQEELVIPTGTWHTLMVRHVGDMIECFFDDKKHLEFKDTTITKPGKVGLWTKADAYTYFDGFQIKDLGR